MNQPIDKAYWKDNLDMGGGEYAKTMVADEKRGVTLMGLDLGVLVKKRGHADRLVPWGNVAAIESRSGFGDKLPESFSRVFAPGVEKEMAAPPSVEEPKKRGPGRPKGS